MMPTLGALRSAFSGRTVLVTGHTGFKGSWLAEWLDLLGARIVGVALAPNTAPSLFDELGLAQRLEHHILDIRNAAALHRCLMDCQPDYVFHLAAQPLVRLSYSQPVQTYSTNVMGTVHLLEALRLLETDYSSRGRYCAAVLVTTDKCYENREWIYGYREVDTLGGVDPYSSSKACAELAIASYRRSFFSPQGQGADPRIGIASVRAGNVIGGGDWAQDRIVPDCMRHLADGSPIPVRNPKATRPWQHVLEPLAGYLILAAELKAALENADIESIVRYSAAYNFGPALAANQPVSQLVEETLRHWHGNWIDQSDPRAPHEASRLNLSCEKAFHDLGWHPQWGFSDTVKRTVNWYRDWYEAPHSARKLTRRDIEAYAGTPTST